MNYIICKTCDGTGEVEDNGPKACPSCGGNGTFEVSDKTYEKYMANKNKTVNKKTKVQKAFIQELIERIEGLQDKIVHANADTMENYLLQFEDGEIKRLIKNVEEIDDLLSK